MAKLDGMNPELVRELLGEVQRACTTMRRVEAEVTQLLTRARVPVQVTYHPRKVAEDLEAMAREVDERLALLEKQEKSQSGKGKPAASQSKLLQEPDISRPADDPKPDKQQSSDGAKAERKADDKVDEKADRKAEGKADEKAERKADDKADQKADRKADGKADQKADPKADDKAGHNADHRVDHRPEKTGQHQGAAHAPLTQPPPTAGERVPAPVVVRDLGDPPASGPGVAAATGGAIDHVANAGAGVAGAAAGPTDTAAGHTAAGHPAAGHTAAGDRAPGSGVMTCQCHGVGACRCGMANGTGVVTVGGTVDGSGGTAGGGTHSGTGLPSNGSQVADTPGKDHPGDPDPAVGQQVTVVDGVKVVSTPLNQPGPELSGTGAQPTGAGPQPDGPPGFVEPLESRGSASGSAAPEQASSVPAAPGTVASGTVASGHGAPAHTGSAQVIAVSPASEQPHPAPGNAGPAHPAPEPTGPERTGAGQGGHAGLAPGDPMGDFVGTPEDDATEDRFLTTAAPTPDGQAGNGPGGDRRVVEVRLDTRPDGGDCGHDGVHDKQGGHHDYGKPGSREV